MTKDTNNCCLYKFITTLVWFLLTRYPTDDSFKGSKSLCDLVQPGVAGVFGPVTPATSALVEAMADTLQVPFMQFNFDYIKTRPDFSINVHPHPRLLGLRWKIFCKKSLEIQCTYTYLPFIFNDLQFSSKKSSFRKGIFRFCQRYWMEEFYHSLWDRRRAGQNAGTPETAKNIRGCEDNSTSVDPWDRWLQTLAERNQEIRNNENCSRLWFWQDCDDSGSSRRSWTPHWLPQLSRQRVKQKILEFSPHNYLVIVLVMNEPWPS